MNLNAIVRRHASRPRLGVSIQSQQLQTCRRYANHVVRAVFTGLLSCGWTLKERNKQFLSFIDHLYDTSLVAARSSELRTAHLKYLKSACHKAREIGLLRRKTKATHAHIRNVTGVIMPRGYVASPNDLFQLSCISRALPPGGDIEVQEALVQFQDTCLGPEPEYQIMTDLDQNEILNFNRCKKTLKKLKHIWDRKSPHASVSPVGESACAAYKAKEGGRTRHFQEMTEKYTGKVRQDRFVSTFLSGRGVTSEAGEQAAHLRRVQKYVEKNSRRTKLLSSRVSAVRELGNKVRIVTVNDPYLVATGHIVRKILFPAVTKLRGNREALGELPLELRLNPKSRPKGRVVISGDLSRATDTLLHSWLSKLCQKLGVEPTLIHIGMKVGDAPVTRGAFMGLPASWTLLELTHWLICVNVDPSGNFFLKGDDIIAWWTKKQWKLYSRLCACVGFEINTSKSFITRSRGTFCEGLYELSQDKRGPFLQLLPTCALRGFVTRSPGAFFPDLATSMNSMVRRGYSSVKLWRLVANSFSKEFGLARKFHVNLYTPECLGGLGLPHPNPSELTGRYISSLVWGGLNGDLSPPPLYALGVKGRFSKIVSKRLREVKFRSALRTEDTCPHFEEWKEFFLMRASVLDCSDKNERSTIGIRKYLGMLRRCEKLVPRASIRATDRVKYSTISALFQELRPLKSSVLKVFVHRCDCIEEQSTV